ncbi:putative F-box protein At5g52610 [Phragmites australis]|uniref:putative F-box protein At5g52610 n=1 Tax=Phragmites australis TaxID=29695 RepID=UPI002D773C0C|nr:putative F-box protein At5g52610 [Phragmites australis]XP_062194552.1 putative F-box protein At5g52610 [Phragmites australis]XP_062194553.1 putative F-box protein At5g52610 [Phragmites australis]
MEGKKTRAVGENGWFICDDALTEVFRRLPARTLASCRLVCKSWLSVLSDPHFIHEHMSRSQQKLLLFAHDRVNDRSLAMVLADDKESMYQLSRPMASRSLFVHNSCNGLLCLGDSTGAVELLNPTTGESLMLPMPMYTAGSSQFSSFNWHCLGFCPGIKEHKVVHFYPGAHIDSFKVRCEIYTIGDTVWRQVGGFHGAPTDRGVHVNGIVYYLTKFCYIASSRINCLNLESEKIDVMMLPPRKSYGGHCSLTDLEGVLCLLVVDGALEGPPRTMDILMLNGDDKQSWTPRYYLSLPWLMPSCYFTPKHTLFHDGKIWVQLLARNLYCYDPSSSSEELKITWPEFDFPFSTHTFIESIVPLRKDYFIKQIQ